MTKKNQFSCRRPPHRIEETPQNPGEHRESGAQARGDPEADPEARPRKRRCPTREPKNRSRKHTRVNAFSVPRTQGGRGRARPRKRRRPTREGGRSRLTQGGEHQKCQEVSILPAASIHQLTTSAHKRTHWIIRLADAKILSGNVQNDITTGKDGVHSPKPHPCAAEVDCKGAQ